MEIVTEPPTILKAPTHSKPSNSEQQQPETRPTPELVTPKNGTESSQCEPKSETPEEKQSTATETGERVKFGGIELPKNGTPNRLKVPKAFKYPERYSSPTDLMMSPISKGLLARTRKGAVLSKMHELRIQEMSLQS